MYGWGKALKLGDQHGKLKCFATQPAIISPAHACMYSYISLLGHVHEKAVLGV